VEACDDYGNDLTRGFSFFKESLMAVELRFRVTTQDVSNERIVYDFCTTLLSNVNMGNLSVSDVPKPTNNVIHSVSTLGVLIEVVHSSMVIFDLFPRAIMCFSTHLNDCKIEHQSRIQLLFSETFQRIRGASKRGDPTSLGYTCRIASPHLARLSYPLPTLR
jgi:hypothetical protein